ncbi:MAG: hypothetical protein ACI9QD_001036, partial [Thermoproteota archaeon]
MRILKILALLCVVTWSILFFSSTLRANSVVQGIELVSGIQAQSEYGKIAVLSHHASRNEKGDHLIDLSIKSGFNVSVLFAPEHGLRTMADEFVGDGIDPQTGLPIVSLYKRNQRYPSDDDLKLFDTIIIDLKDVGVRFYTYATTIFQTINVSLNAGKKIILLDRVNPIGGSVHGPILAKNLAGHFISFFEVPQNHGLTLGEYMNYLFKGHEQRSLLNIIKLKNWDRNKVWNQLQFEFSSDWVTPSPALPTHDQAYLYSIFGSFESLNISVGRSKTNKEAFCYYGAPWISAEEAKELVTKFNKLGFDKYLTFETVQWQVTRSQFNNETARGFKVQLKNFSAIKDRFKILYETLRIFYQQ